MIKKTVKQTIKILLLLLCIAVAVGGFWLLTNNAKGSGSSANSSGSGAGSSGGNAVGSDANGSFASIEYYHYDTAKFDEMCDELVAAAEANNTDEVLRLYDELYSECEEIETLYAQAYILYSMDMDNEYYSEEQIYSFTTLEKCEDKLCGICRDITMSEGADAFREHVGETAFAEFKAFKPYTDDEWALIDEEQKLVDEYYDLYTDPELTYEYKGTAWDMDMIDGSEGDELYESNSTDYFIVLEQVEKVFNAKAGPIYKKLVALRNEFARLRGYDNYAAYADAIEYNRDYTDAEIALLHKDVKKVSKEYMPLYIDYYMTLEEDLPVMSDDELLTVLRKWSDEMGSTAGQAAATLLDEKLYSIGNGKSRQPGGYTMYLPKLKRPFIFITNDEGDNLLPTLTHEFGHFAEGLSSSRNNALTDRDSIDLAEIASNGCECLMSRYYDEVFRGQADQARKGILDELMVNVIYGCIEDEFMRTIYKDPDLTLKEINTLYGKINAEYGIGSGGEDYSWSLVTHMFEQPMYNISYAVSGLAALQIWNASNTDFDGAVRTWEAFLKEGTSNKTYLDVVGRCGLVKFTEPGAVDAICKPALDEFR